MHQQWVVTYLLIVAYIHGSQQQVSHRDVHTYMAAVVEYSPKFLNDSESTLKVNSDLYVKNIEIASRHDVDIIVFPESGLTTVHMPERKEIEPWTTLIPAEENKYIPCSDTSIEVSETLRKISCAAKENRIYVVINIAEKLPCISGTCPQDKMFYYNSNVVFDRTGKVIARYRKTNLFVEPQFNVPPMPEIVTFSTDFGVRFGTFICFDILFHEPALQLTRLHRVTDIVYTTAWFSEVPFLTAVQTQAGWSFAEDVNLLAAGYNRPASGNTGSGIYLGRKGIGKAVMSRTRHGDMLIYEVPKIEERDDSYRNRLMNYNHTTWRYYHGKEHVHDELRKKREANTLADNTNDTIFLLHDNIQAFETALVIGNGTKTLCQNNFCCEFKIDIVKADSNMKYRLVVFNGRRRYVVTEAAVRACGIVQCSNNSISSCGAVQESETVFGNIEITTSFRDYKNTLIMPSTLNSELLPLTNWTYDERFHNDYVNITMSLSNDTNNLLTFGIYSRYFDKKDNTNIAASFDAINYFIILLITLLLSRF